MDARKATIGVSVNALPVGTNDPAMNCDTPNAMSLRLQITAEMANRLHVFSLDHVTLILLEILRKRSDWHHAGGGYRMKSPLVSVCTPSNWMTMSATASPSWSP